MTTIGNTAISPIVGQIGDTLVLVRYQAPANGPLASMTGYIWLENPSKSGTLTVYFKYCVWSDNATGGPSGQPAPNAELCDTATQTVSLPKNTSPYSQQFTLSGGTLSGTSLSLGSYYWLGYVSSNIQYCLINYTATGYLYEYDQTAAVSPPTEPALNIASGYYDDWQACLFGTYKSVSAIRLLLENVGL